MGEVTTVGKAKAHETILGLNEGSQGRKAKRWLVLEWIKEAGGCY